MSITDNRETVRQIEEKVTAASPIRLGVNKKNELVRLVYEICRSKNITYDEAMELAGVDSIIKKGKNGFFHGLKQALLDIRYPSSGSADDPHIMPLKISDGSRECEQWGRSLRPKNIYVEESARDLPWTNSFLKNFPEAKVEVAPDLRALTAGEKGGDPVDVYGRRGENLFVVKRGHTFIKECPCTKSARRCGYWILNIGFGCPIDCSYCYLQQYSNVSGMVFPANVEDYYGAIEEFDRKVKGLTRIGTGEFTDSLALDKYTEYSAMLIPFFGDMKNLILELKTKVSEVDNVLGCEPNENVVVSWSMNTRFIADEYEKGGASIDERLSAALAIARRGYNIGFHFDPIVYYEGWEEEYRSIVEEIFSHEEICKKTAWISLGTLRYTPGLKQVAEQRFSDNRIFYCGEFFSDVDEKMRYQRELRVEMYNKMTGWIRSFTKECWIYLCMEPEDVWKSTDIKEEDRSFRWYPG
ncbi:MAG: hypothetical protein P9L88_02565 [Candidatus Tantalella remota]|nr:hypothetical protein [Candidatus Tantalella remota]